MSEPAMSIKGDAFVYYVGKTQKDIQTRFQEHKTGRVKVAWTSIHPPIEVIENVKSGIDPNDDLAEENLTYYTMKKYGIDNVRGGRYCQVQLSGQQIKDIMHTFSSVNNQCYECGQVGHFVKRCPHKHTDEKETNRGQSAASGASAASASSFVSLSLKDLISTVTDVLTTAVNTTINTVYDRTTTAMGSWGILGRAKPKPYDHLDIKHGTSILRNNVSQKQKLQLKWNAHKRTNDETPAAPLGAAVGTANGTAPVYGERDDKQNEFESRFVSVLDKYGVYRHPPRHHRMLTCQRCGRKNHTVEQCFAVTRIVEEPL